MRSCLQNMRIKLVIKYCDFMSTWLNKTTNNKQQTANNKQQTAHTWLVRFCFQNLFHATTDTSIFTPFHIAAAEFIRFTWRAKWVIFKLWNLFPLLFVRDFEVVWAVFNEPTATLFGNLWFILWGISNICCGCNHLRVVRCLVACMH